MCQSLKSTFTQDQEKYLNVLIYTVYKKNYPAIFK